jgi:hypothetical protein
MFGLASDDRLPRPTYYRDVSLLACMGEQVSFVVKAQVGAS